MNAAEIPTIVSRLAWVRKHPTLTVIALAFLLFVVARTLYPPSVAGEPGFIVLLFSLGAEAVVSVARGFFSMFGSAFRSASHAEKVRVLLLALVLLIPSLGIGSFVLVAAGEFIGQLQCRGGGCAQGGIATTLFLVVAWLCFFIVLALSKLISRFDWWPLGTAPKFRAP